MQLIQKILIQLKKIFKKKYYRKFRRIHSIPNDPNPKLIINRRLIVNMVKTQTHIKMKME